MKKAWQIAREIRENAVIVDRRKEESIKIESDIDFPHGDELIRWNWYVEVPGSRAPDSFITGLVQDWGNQGYDVSEAEKLLPEGIRLEREGKLVELRVLTSKLMKAVREAPKIAGHPYHGYKHPAGWAAVKRAMPASKKPAVKHKWQDSWNEKIYHGWLGQLAGGSFGTAIEGYLGDQIEGLYGKVDHYVTTPETTNDDVVYEVILIEVFEKMGRKLTSDALAYEWVRQLPYGVSAEGVALRNLGLGIYPPESGTFLNQYCDWIGAQMRGMICGMLAPGNPMEAARLAHIDGVISHARNGLYGEIYAAVLVSLAFVEADLRKLVKMAAEYIPAESEYAAKLDYCFSVLESEKSVDKAWKKLDKHFIEYNWIHAYPNLAADLLALWHGKGDFAESMSLLAKAGYDVDCNAGLVGNVLGIIHGVSAEWGDPLNDTLETYLKGKEKMSIKELAARTAKLARK